MTDGLNDSSGDPISDALDAQAKAAIAAGADPVKVQGRLAQINAHLNEHPEIRSSAVNAIGKGADPHAIVGRLGELSQGKAVEEPAEPTPGVLDRTLSSVAGFARQAVTHPIDTAENLATAPIRSAMTALAPGAGDVSPKPGSIAYGAMYSRVAPYGGTDADQALAKQHVVTPTERAAGTAQTLANIAAPGLASKGFAGLVAGGALTGAAYDPEDPVVGGLTGAVVAPTVGKATSLAAEGASRLVPKRFGGESAREATGAPAGTDEGKAMAAANKVYGKAKVDLPSTATAIEQTKPLYDAAYAHGAIQDPTTIKMVQDLLDNGPPEYRAAWKEGQSLKAHAHVGDAQAQGTGMGMSADEQVRALVSLGVPEDKAVAQVPGAKASGGITVEDIDYWKRGLNAKVASGEAAGGIPGSKAALMQPNINTILDRVDQEVPAYAQARSNYGPVGKFNAIRDLLKQKTDALGTVPQAVASVGGGTPSIFRDAAAASIGSDYGLINTVRKAAGKVGMGGPVSPSTADVLSDQLKLKGPDQAALLRRIAADQAKRAQARSAITALAGTRAASYQPQQNP